MKKHILEELVNKFLSIRQIAKHLSTSYTNVRYWLRVYKLKTNCRPWRNNKDFVRKRRCKCGETNPKKFYGNKLHICARCHNQYVMTHGRESRKRAVLFLGGKCKVCGYSKYVCALDIHHLDPTKKDTSFRSMRCWSWERIEKEIKNCVLVCKNCHSAIENEYISIKNLRYVAGGPDARLLAKREKRCLVRLPASSRRS
jgi:hypothetical protein